VLGVIEVDLGTVMIADLCLLFCIVYRRLQVTSSYARFKERIYGDLYRRRNSPGVASPAELTNCGPACRLRGRSPAFHSAQLGASSLSTHKKPLTLLGVLAYSAFRKALPYNTFDVVARCGTASIVAQQANCNLVKLALLYCKL
jgi:hypothetical protein